MLLFHPKETSMPPMWLLFLRKGEHLFGQAIAGGINASKLQTFMEGLIKEWERASDEGLIAIMDSASSYSETMLEELMANAPHDCKFLPPWPPFLNPIEEAFAERKSKIKKLLAERRPQIGSIDDRSRGAKAAGRLDAVASARGGSFLQPGPVAPCYRRMGEYFARCISLQDMQS